MGCDIHLHVEQRSAFDGWAEVPSPDSEDWADPRRWYHGRNYDLFAILADVRNGWGFAGSKTGEGFAPIYYPRGLPDDVSDAVRAESDSWDGDGHSHSHLTVGEILAYDWDQEATLTALFHDKGQNWPSDPPEPKYENGGKVAAIQEYADHYHDLPPWSGHSCASVSGLGAEEYKRVTWRQPCYRCAEESWWATVARAARLAEGDLERVRFVFWFDN